MNLITENLRVPSATSFYVNNEQLAVTKVEEKLKEISNGKT